MKSNKKITKKTKLNCDVKSKQSMDAVVEKNLKAKGFNDNYVNEFLEMINED